MVSPSQIKNTDNKNINIDKEDNLWSSILREVRKQNTSKLQSCKKILVLGDNESGKTTLIAKLQGVEDPRKGSALEYAYIDVRDDYRDDTTRLSVWVLDGDPRHNSLLKFALTKESYRDTLVILTASMMTPWAIMDQLQYWKEILSDHINKFNLNVEDLKIAQSDIMSRWQNYIEPGDDFIEANSPVKRQKTFDESVDMTSEGALTTNLGIDIVVVVTKTDYMSSLEKQLGYKEEHWDFMQQWIRQFCLNVGAALFYTSAKEDKNCDILYKYLTHRIYGLPFQTPALVVEKDAVFIPAGWDNLNKIKILHENLFSCKPNDSYNSAIEQPLDRMFVESEDEILAEEDQAFLARELSSIQAFDAFPTPTSTPGRIPESPLRNPSYLMPPRVPSIGTGLSPKKIDSHKLVPAGQSVLANFFNSLLLKPTIVSTSTTSTIVNTTSPTNTNSDTRTTLRSNVAAELERLSKKKSFEEP